MKYLIIGNSAAGINAIESIREVDKENIITVISDEKTSYYRCLISDYLAGTHKESQLIYKDEKFYKDMNVNLILGKCVISIEPTEKQVGLNDKSKLKYDKLLIATGSSAKSIGVEGENIKGVYKFRTLEDARNILNLCKQSKAAVVLGGGLIGLKAAYGLKKQNLEVYVVIKSAQVLSQVVDKKASLIIAKHLKDNGIKIITGVAAEKILGKDKKVEQIHLDNGRKISCQIVIIGKGVTPNIDIVKNTNIKTQWGIITDKFCRTNIVDIYAGGDVAQTYDIVTEDFEINALWTCATKQGRVAGFNMAGENKEYEGSVAENAISLFDLPIISIGIYKPDSSFEVIEKYIPEKRLYKKLVLKNNFIKGASMVGEFRNSGLLLSLIKNKVNISEIKDILLEDWFGYANIKYLVERQTSGKEVSRSISVEGKSLF